MPKGKNMGFAVIRLKDKGLAPERIAQLLEIPIHSVWHYMRQERNQMEELILRHILGIDGKLKVK